MSSRPRLTARSRSALITVRGGQKVRRFFLSNRNSSSCDADIRAGVDYDKLAKFDIVITSYQIVAQEWDDPQARPPGAHKKRAHSSSDSNSTDASESDSSSRPEPRALFGGTFRRVILDEAHQLKNRKTRTHKACLALAGEFRWCLTGTPIQNNVEDMHALFGFLGERIVPPYQDLDRFKRDVSLPLKAGKVKEGLGQLRHVLGAVMLRRTKDSQFEGKPLIELPERKVIVAGGDFVVP